MIFNRVSLQQLKHPCKILGLISLFLAIFLLFKLESPLNLTKSIGILFLVVSYYLFFLKTEKQRAAISNLIASSFSLAAAIFSLEITGGITSPFLLYLFVILACLPFKTPPFTTVVYSSLTLAVITAQTLSKNVGFAYLIFKIAIAFIPFMLLLAYLISQKIVTDKSKSQEITSEEEYFHENRFIHKLWELHDFIEDIQKASDNETLIISFLKYLRTALGLNDIIVVFKSAKKIIWYKISDGNLTSSEVSAYYNFDSVKRQDKIELLNNVTYSLLENYPNISVYANLTKKTAEENLHLARIATDLFLRKTQELELSSRKNALYEEILSLSEFAESVSVDAENQKLLEKAVSSLKIYSHIEKSLGFFCEKTDRYDPIPDKNRWIIKGRYIKHPEEFWINDFISAARECIKKLKPEIRHASKGSSHIFVIPVISNNNCIAVLGGVTSLTPEEIQFVIEFAEIIASLLSSSLSYLDALKSLDTERIHKVTHAYEYDKVNEIFEKLTKTISENKEEPSLLKEPYLEVKKISNIVYQLIFDLLPFLKHEKKLAIIDFVLNTLRISLKPYGFDIVSKVAVTEQISFEKEIKISKILIPLITNSFLYSESDRCYVFIEEEKEGLRIFIRDEGRGFDVKQVIENVKRNPEMHTGFRTISHLIKDMNGKLKIRSSVGKGTEVSIQIPVP